MLLVFVSYTTFFVFFSYISLVLRQGLAMAFIFYAVACIINVEEEARNKKIFIPLLLASFTHWSAIPIAIIILIIKNKSIRIKHLVLLWALSSILFLSDLQSKIFKPIANLLPPLESYSSQSTIDYYGSVNRIDFLVFSFIWVVIGLYFYNKLNKEKSYGIVLKIYISLNIFFLLFGFIAFSDRLASYSWFFIPVIIWYPLFKQKKYTPVLMTGYLLIFTIIGMLTGTINSLIR